MNENVRISDKKKDHHIPNEVKSLILCFVLLLGSSVKNCVSMIIDGGNL